MGIADLQKRRIPADLWFLGILILAVALRLHGLTADGLWYDELLTAVRAYPSLQTALVSMWQQAVHPPLYQAQLHFWLQIGTRDLWVRLNPFMWNLASLLSFYFSGRRVFSAQIVLLASLFLAISPFHVYYAQDVRMYSLLIFLSVWAWFLTYQSFSASRREWLWPILAALTCLAFLYSHGAGFMILVSVNTLALALLLTSRQWKRFWLWAGVQVVVLLLYIPWLIHAYNRGPAHPIVPSLNNVARTLAFVLVGAAWPHILVGWLEYAPLILLAVSLLLVMPYRPHDRGLVLAFVLVPILTSYAISHLLVPIWIHRTQAYTIPFVCLTFALAGVPDDATQAKSRSALFRWAWGLLVVTMLVTGLIAQKVTFQKVWDFRTATQLVKEEAVAGDAILIPHRRVFWAWNWYFVGPGSIDPLAPVTEVQAEARGVRVFSDPADAQAGQSTWLVYRDLRELEGLAGVLDLEQVQEEARTIAGIHVIRLQWPAPGEEPDGP